MPHTRVTQLRVTKEAAKSRDMLQIQNSTWNMGWNNYQDEDLPGLNYHLDSSSWFLDESAATSQPQCFTDSQFTMADAVNSLLETNSENTSISNFCGLQPWYSSEIQESSLVIPIATTQPQLSGSEFESYESTLLDEESQLSDQSYSSQPWSPNESRQLSSIGDGAFTRAPCISSTVDLTQETIDLTQELDNAPSHSSGDENARGESTQAGASKKRKIAHSIIERNYRSRINSGMAELRHCVPLTAKGSSFLDFKRLGSRQVTDKATSNRLSGKVATLSDAVQYVKSLELESKILHGRLDIMQRRNCTLQKIALSKARTNTPATSTSTNMEKMDEEDTEADDEGSENEQAIKRNMNGPLNRAHSDESKCR